MFIAKLLHYVHIDVYNTAMYMFSAVLKQQH